MGFVDEISRARVSGWVAYVQIGRPTEISIIVNGSHRGTCQADRLHSDPIAVVGDVSVSRYAFSYEFDPPLSPFRVQDVVVRIAADPTFPLENAARSLPIPGFTPTSLSPLIVTSTGRSGSTLLMRELAKHPQVVIADRYPYEIKLVAYYSSAFRTLVANEDRIKSTDPVVMFADDNRFRIGHNPYNTPGNYSLVRDKNPMRRLFENHIPQRYADLFRKTIEEFYELIKLDRNKVTAVLFAEKGDINEAAREGVRLFFGSVKEVVLVRDARDMLCSAKAFWKLSSEEALGMLETTLPVLYKIRASAGSDVLFIRYEDLLRSPVDTRKRLYQFLEIDYRPTTDIDFEEHKRHATSENSVGRWTLDLSADEVERCATRFKSYQDAFGYGSNGPTKAVRTVTFQRLRDLDGLTSQFHPSTNYADFGVTDAKRALVNNLLLEGWSAIEDGYVWSCQPEASLKLNVPPRSGAVQLVADAFVVPGKLEFQTVSVDVNEVRAGTIQIDGFGVIEITVPDIPDASQIILRLTFPDAQRPCDVDIGQSDNRLLGLSLRKVLITRTTSHLTPIRTFQKPPFGGPSDTCQSGLMAQYESLGENCEFGLVQRRCGDEPLGLLRFSSAPLPKLLAALDARFAGMGHHDNVLVELSSNGGEYMIQDKAFGFYYHAWVRPKDMTPEQVRAREVARVPFLVRKLLEDLTDGRKIFVFHAMEKISPAWAMLLCEAIRRYGPGRLLWVQTADAQHPVGSLDDYGNGLFAGYIDRFAPGENAHDLSLGSWIHLCVNALEFLSSADSDAVKASGPVAAN